jgi:hypothetical protein
MNEEDILQLKLAGYIVENGNILSPEGQFLSNVEVNGKAYNSLDSEEDYNYLKEAEETILSDRTAAEEAKNQQKEKITQYEANPLIFADLDDVSDEVFTEYMDKKAEDNEPGAYMLKDDLIAEKKSEAIQEDLVNNLETGEPLSTNTIFTEIQKDTMFQDKGINFDILKEVLPTENRIKEIENVDEDVDTILKGVTSEKKDKDRNIFSKLGDWMWDGIYSGIAALTPDGVGMDDKDLKKEYVGLNEKRKNLLKPEIAKISNVLKEELDFYNKDYEENYSNAGALFGREDQDINNYVRRQLQSKINYLDSFVDDANVYNLISEEFLTDVGTLGLRDAHDAVKYRAHLIGKLENGEELTPTEQRAVENLGRIDLLGGLDLEQSTLYNLTYGAGHSVSYLAGGVFGRMAGKVVGKGIAKGVTGAVGSNFASKLATAGGKQVVKESIGRTVGLVGDIATQATLHTSNLANTIDNYYGTVHMGFDEDGNKVLETDRMQYESVQRDITLYEDALNSGLVPEDQLEATKSNLKYLKQMFSEMKEPQTVGGALAKSWTGNFVESASEVATLNVLKGIPNNLVTRKLTEGLRKTPTWKNLVSKTKSFTAGPTNILNKINKPFPKTMEALNSFSGNRLGNVTIGGNLEEALEEVAVQVVPVWGETDKEAAARKDELLHGSFYFNVLAQAPLQKIIMSPVGTAIRGKNYINRKLDADYRQTKKNFNELMKDLQKGGLEKEEFDEILMAAGSGNFSQLEYKNKIKELDERGETVQANKIRENRIFNAAFMAMKHGKGKEFISALEKSLAKQQAPTTIPTQKEAATIAATIQAITEAKAVQKSMKKVEGLPNAEFILNLEYNKRNLEKNKEGIRAELSAIDASELLSDEQKEGQRLMWDGLMEDTEKGLRVLNKKIEGEKSPTKIKRYKDEASMMVFAKRHLEQQKKEGVEQMSLETAIEEAYGKSISNSSKKKVLKTMEAVEILQIAQQEAKEKAAPIVEEPTEEVSPEDSPETVEGNEITDTGIPEAAPPVTTTPFGTVSTDRNQEVEMLAEEFKEAVSEDMETIEGMIEDAPEAPPMDIFMDMDEDEMIESLGGKNQGNPLVSIGNKMKDFVAKAKKTTGRDVTFEDFLLAVAGRGPISDYKSYLTLFANAWSNAGLGQVNAQEKYIAAVEMANLLNEKIEMATNEVLEISPEQTKKLETEEKALGLTTTETEVVNRDANGIPVVTQKRDNVFDEIYKINNAALEFTEEEVTDPETGEVYIRRTTAPIAKRNEEAGTNINNLVHPDKNNKGDIVTVPKPVPEEIGSIMVSVRNDKGRTVKRISFAEWAEENRGDMSMEEFSETDEYIAKVPMFYVDSEGQKIGWVAEADWFNPSTEGEMSEADRNNIKVSNLSGTELAEIERKKQSALSLRKEILAGNVEQFEIVSDGTSFVRLYFKQDEEGNTIPPKPLSEVAPDSQIAIMGVNGLHFVDGQTQISTDDIINWGDSDSGFSRKVEKVSADGKSKKFVVENANKAVYLQHVATVNGVKKYEISLTQRQNDENGAGVPKSVIETVRILAAANTILMNDTFSVKKPGNIPFIAKDNPYRMTKEQAQQIHDKVKKETGLSLSTSLNELIEGLVNIKDAKGGKVSSGLTIASLSNRWDKDNGHAVKDSQFVENTKFGRDTHLGKIVSIAKTDNGQFEVNVIAESYIDYLKDTHKTNMMGYNVGTSDNPVYTPAIQQAVRIKPIRKVKPVNEIVEENTTAPTVIQKTEKIVEEVNNMDEIAEVLDIEVETKTEEQKVAREAALNKAIATIEALGGQVNTVEESDELIVSEMTSAQNVTDSILITEGLTVEQEEDLIGSLAAELADKNADYKQIMMNLNSDLAHANTAITNSKNDLIDFKGNPTVDAVLNSLNTLSTQIQKVRENRDRLLAEASDRGRRDSFVVDVYEETEGMSEKDYGKKSNEALPVDKLGTALKRIFAKVETGQKGFLGRNKIAPFKSMYDTVLLTLSESIGATTDFKDMMNILREYSDSNYWMKSLIEKLEASDEQIQNAFVYNMHAQKVTAYFSGFTQNNNTLNATFYESNSNSAVRAIKRNWQDNFNRTALNDMGQLNLEEVNRLYNEYLSWGKSPEKQDSDTLRYWLDNFGIRLSEKTMEQLMLGELRIVKDGVAVKQPFKALFEHSAGVFNILNEYLIKNKDAKGDLGFSTNTKLNPFSDMHSLLEQLAYLEAKNNNKYASTTRRSGGKTLSEVENMTYFYQQIRKLKNSVLSKNSYVDKLRKTSFAQDSYMLRMLKEDPEFVEAFDHGLMDLMALKDIYKDSPMFASIEELSEEDYQLALRIAFQAKGRDAKMDKKTGFKIRLSNMNTLTNSDKGRMVMLKTFVYDFFRSEQAFDKDEKGNFVFSDNLNELMWNDYVMPELRRMHTFINSNQVTDIKGYSEGAVRFNVFPVLNTITNKKGQTIKEAIEAGASLEQIKEQFKTDATKEVEKNTFAEAEKVSTKRKTNNDAEYLAGRKVGTPEEKNFLAEVDFILNSKLSSMNYMQMVAGDPALYYKSKADSTSKNLKEATKASMQSAINLGKRMAAMIAPGKNLANSKGNKYIQLFMDDIYGSASNLEDIIGWHYPVEEIDEMNPETKMSYRAMIKVSVSGDTKYDKILKAQFDTVSDFIGIESTDAQEYSSVKEHLYILEKQGRLPQETINEIREKIDMQHKFYHTKSNVGKPIPAELSLSTIINSKNKAIDGKTQLEILLQPIKPVYTGSMLEGDVNRIVYIKTSSFPLIPELTAGTKLDKLRVQMERIELETGKTVRAVHHSGAKVGGFTADKTITNFDDVITAENHMVLDREHFKIQQDVPSKAGKPQDDYVSMGTQIFKLLFGDGIDTMEGFEFDGEPITGQELKEKFFQTFSGMVNMKRGDLLESLGLDKNMVPKNLAKSKELLQKLLIAEAKSRGFAKQDLKALELVGKNKNFRLPLWASGNSNKFEAMLNALINNKIFRQKIPGNKFVTASEGNMELQEGIEGYQHMSKVIRIGNYKGGELQSTTTKDGKLLKAQVLMPSRIKLGGRLVDIFDDFIEETGEGTYIKLVDGAYQLKTEMMDEKLLEQFVFRIPTSSHGLGSAVEIAGFLPPESGDLVITPKSFVAQMGQDFDIDALTAYQYNHVVREDGRIEKLTQENKDVYLEEKKRQIADLEQSIRQNGKYGPETAILFNDILASLLGEEESLAFNMYPETEEELQEAIKKLKSEIPKNMDKKLLENDFIQIHISVFSNPAAQQKINKALSMAFAEGQAEDIEELIQSLEEEGTTFDMLSPEYQRVKMDNGSTGQVAIGIYAKAITLHSNMQQALVKGGVHLTRKVFKNGKLKKTRAGIAIGNLYSSGNFGTDMTISNSKNKTILGLRRAISTVLDERANTATDNEKAQILGKTGLNHKSAIAVDSMLAMLGFDAEHQIIGKASGYTATEKPSEFNEDNPFHRSKKIAGGKTIYYKEYSIPYLLHSQPIVKEFFALLGEKESISAEEFSMNPKGEVIQELILKYGGPEYTIVNGEYGIMIPAQDGTDRMYFESSQRNEEFTGQRLADNIKLGDKADTIQQLEILALYTQLMTDADGIKEANKHVDLDNLGKSMWESSTKEEEFREYFTNLEANSNLEGIENLVGEFYERFEVEQMEEADQEGLLYLGDNIFLKPTTNQGVMIGSALSLSANIFNGLFPAKSVYLNKVVNKILANSRINPNNSFAVIKAKEKIFQEVKKYLTSAEILGLFNTNAKEVRENLFIDVPGYNTSLSSYTDYVLAAGLKKNESSEYKAGLDKVRGNLFLNLLNFQYGENGKPSLITFNNQESFEANQEAIYTAFKELIAEDISLPRIMRNGKSEYYSTRLLAQELIAYSYSSGGVIQGAVEFHKFLPIEYLDDMVTKTAQGKEMTPSTVLRRFHTLFNNDDNNVVFLEEFEQQFYQNNPGMAAQHKLKRSPIKEGGEFYTLKFSTEGPLPTYISERAPNVGGKNRSKLKQHQWKLYKLDSASKVYYPITTLGTFGMAEYEYQNQNLTSSMLEKEFVNNKASGIEVQMREDDILGELPGEGTPLVDAVGMIANGEFGDSQRLIQIAKFIGPLLKTQDTLKYNQGNVFAKGSTGKKTGQVSLNTDKISSREDYAITLLHESLHNLTSRFMTEFLNEDGTVKKNAPSEMYTFMNVYNQYKTELRKLDPDKYDQFMKEFTAYKEKRKNNESVRPDGFTLKGDEFEAYYAMVNPKEFLAVTLSNENDHFKKLANQMDYYSKVKGFRNKLVDIITRIVNIIAKRENLRENSVALQAIQESLMVVKAGSKFNYQAQKSITPDFMPPDIRDDIGMPAGRLAEIEAMMLQDSQLQELPEGFMPEGASAGASFLSVTEDINNKCK